MNDWPFEEEMKSFEKIATIDKMSINYMVIFLKIPHE